MDADASSFGWCPRRPQRPLPGIRELVDDLVDLVLRSDVDASCGLVEDEHLRLGEHPLGQDNLLLVAAGQLADAFVDRRCLDQRERLGSPTDLSAR